MNKFHPGYYQSQGSYKSFQPSLINKQWHLDDAELQQLLSHADRQIGRLDMYSSHVPNVDLFISMHIRKEATQSSRIEGTQTNIEEALLDKENVAPERRDDWQEVQNYITATNEAMELLHRLPFSSRLFKKAHYALMQNVRGQHKLPGAFRASQNWIGGATIRDAAFIPPVHSSIQELMSDLEHFAHNEEQCFPELLKIALIHYQFETIHPFLDGNGRIGRLMISLYLAEKKILSRPVLYLSDFFEKNRQLYYDNLMAVRTKGDLKTWFRFFLVGIIETAQSGIETFDQILKLKEEILSKIQLSGKRTAQMLAVMDFLYQKPLLNAQQVISTTGVSQNTAYRIIESLVEMGVLREITGAKKDRLYLFQRYVDLF